MASSVPVFLILSACLFTTIVGFDDCGMSKGQFVVCGVWTTEFCCGTCDERYCCVDPQKRFAKGSDTDCILKNLRSFQKSMTPHPSDFASVASVASVAVPIVGLLAFVVFFLICWVSPCCWLHKRFRNPRPGTAATSVVVTQTDISYQPLANTIPYGGQPTPVGQLYVLGPPPSYQDAAGPGYPHGGQALYPLHPPAQPRLPTDYTLPQPAYNPSHVETLVIT